MDDNLNFHPKFFYTKNLKATEIINTVKSKNDNKEELMDDEAIDLIITPDMDHNCDIKELMITTSNLLVNAIISDKEFHRDLIACQLKMLKRFFQKRRKKGD